MAEVTGLTADRMLDIEAASVVSGEIDVDGHLILTTHGGTEIDAGYALVAITDGSITTAKLQDDAVTGVKLADLAVDTSHLVDSSVTSIKIANGTIVDADISASASIAQSKIANLTTDLAGKASTSHVHGAGDVTSGTLDIARIPTGTSGTTVSLGNHTHSVLANLVVGDSAWTNVSTFTNSWVNYDTTTHIRAQYRKLPSGLVALQGTIKSGTIGQAAFTLPAGYRPGFTLIVPAVEGANTGGRLDINANGTVVPQSGSNVFYAFAVTYYPV